MLEEDYVFYGIVAFIWTEFLWEMYLSIRQHKIYPAAAEVPTELQGILDDKTYQKARMYSWDKSSYEIAKDIFDIALTMAIISVDGLAYFWHLSADIVASAGFQLTEIVQSLVFILIMNLFSTIINLPFSIYNTFVLEEKHGFNKQTVAFYVKDKIKGFIVSQFIMLPLISGIIYIVQRGGNFFFIYLWLFAMATTFFLLTVYPNYIAPLFDKYTPLPEGELRTRIEELAQSIEFPLYKLYVVEGSKRSTHSNAYFYGFFKNKRIVLFDTLLKDYVSSDDAEQKKDEKKDEKEEKKDEVDEKKDAEKNDTDEKSDKDEKKEKKAKGCDDDEVLAVLGHELGHWKLNHVLKNIIIMQVNLLLVFAVFAYMFRYDKMYKSFGFHDETPVLIGLLIVLQFIFLPYNALLSFVLTILSRKFEFEADEFAKSLGKSKFLRQALIKLNEDNLGFPVYDWLFSMWHHSHPPLLQRLKALDADKDKKE